MSNLYWLSEEQMARLRPHFSKSHGVPRDDDRRVLSRVIFINRIGLRWCDAPKEYGPPKTLYNRWKRWSDIGVFARIMTGLAAEAPDHKPPAQVKPDEALRWPHPRCRRWLSSQSRHGDQNPDRRQFAAGGTGRGLGRPGWRGLALHCQPGRPYLATGLRNRAWGNRRRSA